MHLFVQGPRLAGAVNIKSQKSINIEQPNKCDASAVLTVFVLT